MKTAANFHVYNIEINSSPNKTTHYLAALYLQQEMC